MSTARDDARLGAARPAVCRYCHDTGHWYSVHGVNRQVTWHECACRARAR